MQARFSAVGVPMGGYLDLADADSPEAYQMLQALKNQSSREMRTVADMTAFSDAASAGGFGPSAPSMSGSGVTAARLFGEANNLLDPVGTSRPKPIRAPTVADHLQADSPELNNTPVKVPLTAVSDAASVDLGGGRTFSHFTDYNGVSGITSLTPAQMAHI